MKKVKVANEVNSLVTKLNERLARDERRYENSREVYSYRKDGIFSDNLLLLDSVCKDVHADVFKRWYDSFNADDKKRFKGVEVVHIGVFNKITLKMITSKVHKVIFKGE